MNKTEFIEAVSRKADMPKTEAKKAVSAFIDVVKEAMEEGDKVTLIGFGTFSVNERPERMGTNPQTGGKMKIAARRVVKFKPGAGLALTAEK